MIKMFDKISQKHSGFNGLQIIEQWAKVFTWKDSPTNYIVHMLTDGMRIGKSLWVSSKAESPLNNGMNHALFVEKTFRQLPPLIVMELYFIHPASEIKQLMKKNLTCFILYFCQSTKDCWKGPIHLMNEVKFFLPL